MSKEKEIIETVTEAYSMQPASRSICKGHGDYNVFDGTTTPHEHNQYCCEKIVMQTVQLGRNCGDPVEDIAVVGYGFNGNKMFEFKANAVNIYYAITDPQPPSQG